MNLSAGPHMHLICLPADGTLDFMVIRKEGESLRPETEGCCSFLSYFISLVFEQGFLRYLSLVLTNHNRKMHKSAGMRDEKRVEVSNLAEFNCESPLCKDHSDAHTQEAYLYMNSSLCVF